MEASVGRVNKSLAALLRRFDELHARTTNHHRGGGQEDEDNAENSGADYAADNEVEDRDQQRLRHNHRGMGGQLPREVHNNDNAFSKIKFKIPSFDGKYDPDAYLTWEMAESLLVMNFLKMHVLELLLVTLLFFLPFGR